MAAKAVLKKKAAALRLKLAKAAEVHKQAHLEALRHAQEAADLEAALEGEGPVFNLPEPPSLQSRDTPLPCPDASRHTEPDMDIPVPTPKRSWWDRFFS